MSTAGMAAFSITSCITGNVASTSSSRLEYQFVMHLQQHARRKSPSLQRILHADHGAANDVGRRTLDWRIDGGALVEGADRRV